MHELGIFIDESGTQTGTTPHYIVTLVFHDQSNDLIRFIEGYETSLAERSLPDIPFHSTPLLNGHDAYANFTSHERGLMLSTFSGFLRRLPISYATVALESKYFRSPNLLEAQLRRAFADLLVDHYPTFLAYDRIKVFYDNGQPAISKALREAFRFALSKQAVLYPETNYHSYRLAQAAGYLCAIEFTALKYATGTHTRTDERFLCKAQSFRRNYLKQARRKKLQA